METFVEFETVRAPLSLPTDFNLQNPQDTGASNHTFCDTNTERFMQRSMSSSMPPTTHGNSSPTTNGANTAAANKMRSSLFGGAPRRGGFGAGVVNNAPSTSSNNNNDDDAARRNYRMDVEEDARRENERAMTGLADDMSRLRREAEFLRGEVASQNELIDSVQNFMVNARDGIVSSVSRLDSTMKRFGVKHTLLFAVGVCGAFFISVWLVKGMLFAPANPSPAASSSSSTAVDGKDVVAMAAQGLAQAGNILAKEKAMMAPPIKLAGEN